MNAAFFVKIGLFQHANAPAAVAAAGACYRCSLFKYDAERFADGGTARALRALRLGHCDGQAGEVHALSDDGTLCGGSLPDGHFGVRQRVVRIRLRHLFQQHVAAVVAVAVRHLEPDLVAGEREDGRKYLRHGIEDDPQRALCRASGGGIRAVAVQAVLDDIEIEARKRHDAEIIDGVGAGQEFIVLIDRQF